MARRRRKRRGEPKPGPPARDAATPAGAASEALETRRWQAIAAIAVPAAVAILLFAVTLSGPFLYDDVYYVVEHLAIREIGNIPSLWLSAFPAQLDVGIFRPLTATSYAFDHAIAGLEPGVFHAVNILLHAAISALLALCLLRLGLSPVASGAGGLLFAAHPVHTEAVAWATGRSELLAALFCLLALLAWIAFRRRNRKRWLAASAVAYLLALGAKEIAVSLPAVLLIGDYYSLYVRTDAEVTTGFAWIGQPRRVQVIVRDVLAPYAAFVVALLAYLGLRLAALGALTYRPELLAFAGDPASTRVLTAIAGLGQYARLLILPLDLTVIYEAKQTGLSGAVLSGFVVAIGSLGWVVWQRKRDPWPAFCIGWLALFLLVVSNLVIEIGAVLAERFLYLPSIGLCGLAAVLAGRGLRARRAHLRMATVAVLFAVVGLYSVATVRRSLDWTDTIRFWRKAYAQAPGSVKASENLAAVLVERGKATGDEKLLAEATEVRRQGVEVQIGAADTHLTEDHVRMLSQLSHQLHREGRHQEALAQLEKLTPLLLKYRQLPETTRINGIVAHGETLEALGRLDDALAIYEKGRQAFPQRGALLMTMGNALKKAGRTEEAIAKYREAVAVEPGFGLTYVNMASALADAGRTDEALMAAVEALRRGETEHAIGVLEYVSHKAGAAPSPEARDAVRREIDARLPEGPRVQSIRAWLAGP